MKRWQIILIAVIALYVATVILGVILYMSGDEVEPIETRTTATTTQP